MNYFCSVHMQSKKDEEDTIYIVLEVTSSDVPTLTKDILLANGQYQEFVQKHKAKFVMVEYVVYATEADIYASLQNEAFEAIIQNSETERVAQSELPIDCIKDKITGKKKKKKKRSPVMIVSVSCGVLVVGIFGYGFGNMQGRTGAQSTDAVNQENYTVDENGMMIPEQAEIAEGADQITVSIDRSYYAVPTEDIQLKGEVVDGKAYITLPEFDRTDFFTHIPGYTWGFTSDPDGEKIEYYGGTTYAFSKDTKLYRVLVKYGGGSGTKDDPYLINYYDQLELMAEEKARGYFKQTADISFPDYAVHTPINTVNELKSSPDDEYFSYDGGGYLISHLTSPLFGSISGAAIENVNIISAVIETPEYNNYGFIACEVYNYRYDAEDGNTYETGETRIRNCTVSHSSINVYIPKSENETAEVITAEVVVPPDLIEYDEEGNIIEPTEPVVITPTKTGENAAGAITGLGGQIEGCYVNDVGIFVSLEEYYLYVGGISGKPANVTDCVVNYFAAQGTIFNAGGIAGSAGGSRMYNAQGQGLTDYYGGNIQGCVTRDITLTTEISAGGIAGESTTDADSALISNNYSFNISLFSGVYDNDGNLQSSGACGGVIGADGKEKHPHTIVNSVSPAEYLVIGSKRISAFDDSVRLAPGYAFHQENILTILNRNSVNPNKPKEIFTGSFRFDYTLFGDDGGALPYPDAIKDLFVKTIITEEASNE